MLRGTFFSAHRRAMLCIGLAAFAAILYLKALSNPFAYDDFRVIVENTSIQDLSDLEAIVILEPTRPMVNLTYAIDRAVWGLDPFGFHLTSLILHVINVVLVFALAGRLVDDRVRSGLTSAKSRDVVSVAAAALFAAHPVLSQAVGYVAARSELLCGVFFLLALLAGRRWLLGGGPVWWGLTVVAWLTAVVSKEVGGMFPLVLLAYERLVMRLPAVERRRAWRLHGPLLGLGAAAVAARVAVLAVVQYPGEVVVEWRYAVMQLDVIVRYLTLLVAPRDQSVFHAVPLIDLTDPRAWRAVAIVSGLVAAAIAMRHRAATFTLAVSWFLLLLIPSTVLVLLDRAEPMAEHRIYVASIGLFLALGSVVGAMAFELSRRHSPMRFVVYLLFAVAVAGLAVRTMIRNVVWSNPVALWTEAVDLAPEHWFPRQLLGEALHAAGRREDAIAAYQGAIELRPEEIAPHQKLALALAEVGRHDEARETFARLGARHPHSPVVTNGFGAIAMLSGDHAQARAHFLESIARDPANVVARQALVAMAEQPPQDFAEALRLCQEIQQLAPRTPGNDDCIRRNQTRPQP